MESEFHPSFNWRDHLRVHPAADLFPLLAETDPKALQVLAEDIRKNGLRAPIILASIALCNNAGMATGKYNKPMLLDGRNRLDALSLLGWLEVAEKPRRRPDYRLHDHIPVKVKDDIDWEIEFKFVSTIETAPEVLYETAISLNLHRRHLTAEQKRELIANGQLFKMGARWDRTREIIALARAA
jgi:ParB-like chromosome segregation protein Spo0J